MSRRVEDSVLHWERLRQLAERRHAASLACRRLADSARTMDDRIVYEEMARRIADEATALRQRMQAWRAAQDPGYSVNRLVGKASAAARSRRRPL